MNKPTQMFAFNDKAPKKPLALEDNPNGEDLLHTLMETPYEEVVVLLDQVIDLIGEEKANELCLFVRNMDKLIRPRVRKGSLIPAEKRVSNRRLAGFIREDLLDAIEKAHFKKKLSPVVSNAAGVPDPIKVSIAKEQKGVS